MTEFENIIKFPYKLDIFQEKSINTIRNGNNVLVTAHTSAGKSTIAEYAISHAMYLKKRVIYTSPIKALSNQKYSDFQKKFGKNVGIMTGDIKVRPDAPILVATTEIVNNLLYLDQDYFNEIYALILDEVHYIRDEERGHVWEEVITLCPKNIILVMLSASIPGANGFAKWVEKIKEKPCELISTLYRPVPLIHNVYWNGELSKIMDNNGNMFEKEYRNSLIEWKKYADAKIKDKPTKSKILNDLLGDIEKKELFPSLFFMFSRKNCENLAKMVQKTFISGKDLTDSINLFEYYVKKFLGESGMQLSQVWMVRSLLLKGICIHHSGLIPVLKEIIETLFDKGWIKVMFVTETFSVGINMPTKCVIFGELTKFDGKSNRFINPEEYCQMAGRAGRRGKDVSGTVIYFPFPPREMLTYHEIYNVLNGTHTRVSSKFQMDPVLLLRCFVTNRSPYELLENSMMAFETFDYIKGLNIQKEKLQKENLNANNSINDLINKLYGEDRIKDIDYKYQKYIELQDRLKKTNKTNAKKKIIVQIKNLINDKIALTDELIKLYTWKDTSKTEILKNEKNIIEAQNYIKETLDWQINVLTNSKYLEFSTNELKDMHTKFINSNIQILPEECVTMKGKIASCINESDAFLSSEFLMNLSSFECNETIWAILIGSLVDDKSFDDSDSDPLNIMSNIIENKKEFEDFKELFNKLKEIYDILDKQQRLRDYRYTLCPAFGCYVYLWNIGYSFSDIQKILPWELYEGNFVRNMLKTYNIMEEFINASDILQEHNFMIMFSNMKTKIIRDIVINDSLYVS